MLEVACVQVRADVHPLLQLCKQVVVACSTYELR